MFRRPAPNDRDLGFGSVADLQRSPAPPRTAEVLAAAFSAAVRNVLLYRSLLQSIEEVAEARKQSRA